MTPAQRELARHALDLPNELRRSYRNRYFASQAGLGWSEWMEMVAAGEATLVGRQKRIASAQFALTPKGAGAALEPRERLCPEDFPQVPA